MGEEMNYKKYISKIADGLTHSEIDRIFEMAARMEDVVVLAMGQPDFSMPEEGKVRGKKAIDDNRSRYDDDLGNPSFLECIRDYCGRKFGLDYDPKSEILVCAGVSNGIDTAIRALIDPGDKVIVHEPCYNSYIPSIRMAGGEVISVETKIEDGFKLKPEALRAAAEKGGKLLILNYPNNPTGATLNKRELDEIARIACEYDLIVLADEVYSELKYDGPFDSMAAMSGMKERTILLNGVSKSHSMPGYRIGYACGPKELIDAMLKVHQYGIINAPTISQFAALGAMESGDPYILEKKAIYKERKEYLCGRLDRMGLRYGDPQGAMFVFIDIRGTGMDSKTFCDRLLFEGRVALVPGFEFGACGEGFARISYSSQMENLVKAMDRLEVFLEKSRGWNVRPSC